MKKLYLLMLLFSSIMYAGQPDTYSYGFQYISDAEVSKIIQFWGELHGSTLIIGNQQSHNDALSDSVMQKAKSLFNQRKKLEMLLEALEWRRKDYDDTLKHHNLKWNEL